MISKNVSDLIKQFNRIEDQIIVEIISGATKYNILRRNTYLFISKKHEGIFKPIDYNTQRWCGKIKDLLCFPKPNVCLVLPQT